MLKRILVPLDGSPRAEQALPAAAHLAQASEGTLVLVNVVNVSHEAVSYGIGGMVLPPDTIEGAVLANRTYLHSLIQRTHLTGRAAVEPQVAVGSPAERILQIAQNEQVDLIVMVSHGYTGLKQWVMGSVAEKVAHHAPLPVLILRDGEPMHTHLFADGSQVVRALVPLDLAAHFQDAILPAAELVAALSSPGKGILHLLQMIMLLEDANESEKVRLLEAARTRLDTTGQSIRESMRQHFRSAFLPKITWSISTDSDIAEGIARIAENGEETETSGKVRRCDIIAMTTHSLNGVQRWVTGSITDRVLHMTRLPLLIVRPAEIIAREVHHATKPEQARV